MKRTSFFQMEPEHLIAGVHHVVFRTGGEFVLQRIDRVYDDGIAFVQLRGPLTKGSVLVDHPNGRAPIVTDFQRGKVIEVATVEDGV